MYLSQLRFLQHFAISYFCNCDSQSTWISLHIAFCNWILFLTSIITHSKFAWCMHTACFACFLIFLASIFIAWLWAQFNDVFFPHYNHHLNSLTLEMLNLLYGFEFHNFIKLIISCKSFHWIYFATNLLIKKWKKKYYLLFILRNHFVDWASEQNKKGLIC